MKFNTNPSGGSRGVPCGRGDMTQLTVACHNSVCTQTSTLSYLLREILFSTDILINNFPLFAQENCELTGLGYNAICYTYPVGFFLGLRPVYRLDASNHTARQAKLYSFYFYRLKPASILTPLQPKRRPLYLKTQSVPRCKHFSSRL